jgi:4Fe-4S ferredoxin
LPLKTLKKETPDVLTLEWVLQVKNYKLTLDKHRCVGCQICSFACPKEAIKTQKQPKNANGKAQKATVDVDLEKCTFCGICDAACPFGAIQVTLNGNHDLSILQKESFPQLVKVIHVDTEKCLKDCVECETACPFKLIKVSTVDLDGQPVKDVLALSPEAQKRVRVKLDIQKEHCPTCRVCEFKCPPEILKVKKTYKGKISIKKQKCPSGCTDCLDVCPVPGALKLGDDKKVAVNESFCVYCGACKNVCPVDQALTVKRTSVSHTPIHSGAWNKALERITSLNDATKELNAEADKKRLSVIIRRVREGELH